MSSAPRLVLCPLSGATALEPLVLAGGLRIGRAPGSELLLLDPHISRQHALIETGDGGPVLRDLGSPRGCEINGQRLAAQASQPLRAGDRIRFGGWLFEVRPELPAVPRLDDVDDTVTTALQVLPGSEASPDIAAFAQFAAAAAACRTQADLDRSLLAEVRLQGVLDAAFVLVRGEGRGVQVASADPPDASPEGLSRAQLARAAEGGVLILPASARLNSAHTLVGTGPAWTLCVALRDEAGVTAWLYGWRNDVRPPDAALGHYLRSLAELAQALRRGLAQRQQAERHARLAADLADAQRVQARLLPAESGQTAGLAHARLFRPGRSVSGDLLLVLPDVRGGCAFALGDVSGSGAGAALLMAQLCGLLQGALPGRSGLGEVAGLLNRALLAIGEGRFASLVLGRFHPAEDRIELLDAGHGMVFLAPPGGRLQALELHGGPPLGVMPVDYASQAMRFAAGSRLLLVSDGIVELAGGDGASFGNERAMAAVDDQATCRLDRLASALDAWAGPAAVPDDASALLLQRD